MRATLDDALFDPAAQLRPLDLFALLRMGWQRRHELILPGTGQHFTAWATQQTNPLLQAQLQNLQQHAAAALRREPPHWTVHIAPLSQPDWAASTPRLPLHDALLLLSRPLHILMENARSDRNLLLALLPDPERKTLQDAVEQGWCVFQNGGGLGELTQWLQEPQQNTPQVQLRTWVLFDHDGDAQETPAPASSKLGAFLQARSIPYWRLQRRNAESYLSRQVLGGWISHNPGLNNTRLTTYQTQIKPHPPATCHYLNLKQLLGREIGQPLTLPQYASTFLDPKADHAEREAIASSLLRCL